MKEIFILFIILILRTHCFSQGIFVPFRVLSKPKVDECRFENKPVSEVKPTNCDLENGCNYLYPVLIEHFDNNFDLPNKWQFKVHGGSDDNVTGKKTASTWYGDAYYYDNNESNIVNNNIKLNNGIMTILTIPGAVMRDGRSYVATGGAITSCSQFRTGTFEARIKVPTANKMWPAFWLMGNSDTYAEIDIFEFNDDNTGSNGGTIFNNSQCDTYNLHKMTLHTGSSTNPTENKCKREDKYPLDIIQWHTYKLMWDEYQLSIFVDGNLRGVATKYYRGISSPFFPCQYGSSYNYFDPAINYDCNMLSNEPNNITLGPQSIPWPPRPAGLPSWLPWPPTLPPLPSIQTNIPNRVDESIYFPNKQSAMNLILNSGLNITYNDDIPNEFSQSELKMEVDWIKVYQPFCCGVNKTVCSLLDLDNQTYKTDILTGQKLTIGNSASTCNFKQFLPGSDYKYDANGNIMLDPTTGDQVINYRDIPVILLATDEIAIYGDASFPGNTYAEMRITNCGSPNRISSYEQTQIDDFLKQQQHVADSLNNNILDSLMYAYAKSYVDSISSEYNTFDECKFSISPNPAQSIVTINFSNEDCFERVKFIFLIDVNGREFELEKSQIINIEKYTRGSYLLKIIMMDGSVKIDKLIKT